MAIYDLNRSELNSLLASNQIDHSVRQSIIDYLADDSLLRGHRSTVHVETNPPLDSNAQVLAINTPTASIITDPTLKVVVDLADANLTVAGNNDVLIATGPGDDLVNITGMTGAEVVMTGSGNDTVYGGSGPDSIYGGAATTRCTAAVEITSCSRVATATTPCGAGPAASTRSWAAAATTCCTAVAELTNCLRVVGGTTRSSPAPEAIPFLVGTATTHFT
jgi:Ca2+-binding RTX toxin-like protein